MINPYEIMNITPNSSLTDLKKSYYQLALICHPDKGGTEEDMIVIHNAYKYIKEQLENCDNIGTYEELEDEFNSFCKEQEEAPPPFRDIWEDSEEKNLRDEFNSAFEESNIDSLSELDSMPIDKGYQRYMVESKYRRRGSVGSVDYKPLNMDELTEEFEDSNGEFIEQVEFENKVIEYKDPVGILEGEVKEGIDYYDAFCKPIELDSSNIKERTLEELIAERAELKVE